MKVILWICSGIIMGLFVGFVLFGMQILPKTVWTWDFPYPKPIPLEGTNAAPILVRVPSGDYFIVYKYTEYDDYWELLDYSVRSNGKWGKLHNNYSFPLTVRNAEVFMLPSDVYINGDYYKLSLSPEQANLFDFLNRIKENK
jgi:hypothetical protein